MLEEVKQFLQNTPKGSSSELATFYERVTLSNQIAKVLVENSLKLPAELEELLKKEMVEPLQKRHLCQIQKVFSLLKEKDFQLLLQRLIPPVANQWLENLVRMYAKNSKQVGKKELQQVVLSALLCPLRQTVGSCFATAPAIFMQTQSIMQVAHDLSDLLMSGSLKRVVEEKLLKFPTVPQFKQAHLYTEISGPKFLDRFPSLKKALRQRLPQENAPFYLAQLLKEDEIKDPYMQEVLLSFLSQVDHLLLGVWENTLASFSDFKGHNTAYNLSIVLGLDPKTKGGLGAYIKEYFLGAEQEIQSKLEEIRSEHEANEYRIETSARSLQSASNHEQIARAKAQMNAFLTKGEALQREFDDYAQKIGELSKAFEYFFEKVQEQLFFQFQELFYPSTTKSNALVLYDEKAGFRLVYKHMRNEPSVWEIIHTDEQFIQCLCHYFENLQRQMVLDCPHKVDPKHFEEAIRIGIDFLKTKAYLKFAYESLSQLNKYGKVHYCPYAYFSGGTISTLLQGYFQLAKPPKEQALEVQNAEDLCVQMIDLLKDLPFHVHKEDQFLMVSPTHAFCIRLEEVMLKAIEDRQFTYTWVRDHWAQEVKNFYLGYTISAAQFPLVHTLLEVFIGQKLSTPPAFHGECKLAELGALYPQLDRDLMGSFIFETFPLIEVKDGWIPFKYSIQKNRVPLALVFADTNWPFYDLAFVIHPVTFAFELWRVTQDGAKRGASMQRWITNGETKGKWGVYLDRKEYLSVFRPLEEKRSTYKA